MISLLALLCSNVAHGFGSIFDTDADKVDQEIVQFALNSLEAKSNSYFARTIKQVSVICY